jgi:poly(3-hydroxybutyrate) depolymerase
LGRTIDLSKLKIPMYLLAGSTDQTVAPQQLFALAGLAGTAPENLRCELADSDHLGLFMGKRVLEECWPKVVRWMRETHGTAHEQPVALGARKHRV